MCSSMDQAMTEKEALIRMMPDYYDDREELPPDVSSEWIELQDDRDKRMYSPKKL